jgi:hypothetical protein
MWLAAGCAAVIGFCAIRAVARGYVPLDDDAVIETRSRDVFSGRIPLLGSASSVSRIGPETVNHPGPLLFDLLAVPVRLLPNGAGVAIGVAILHVAAIAALAWATRRFLGEPAACVVMAVSAAFVWSLGSEAWFEAWPPVVLMLPFLVALVTAWGWAAGHDEFAVALVVTASLAVQTHGSYVLLGPGVVAASLALRLLTRRRVPLARRPLIVAAALAVLVWLQPLVDQIAGRHNMTAMWNQAVAGDERTLGFVDAVRAAAMVLVKPPWWLRPGVDSALPNTGGLAPSAAGPVFDPDWLSFPVAAAGLAALVGALLAVARTARRRDDSVVRAGAVIGLAAVLLAVASLARLPVDDFGFTAHKVRWLWPLGAYLTAFALVAVLRSRIVATVTQAALSMATIGAVALAATLPTSSQWLSPQQFMVDSNEPARELRGAVGLLDGRGVVFLDLAGRPFPDPFNDTIAAAMTARGISFKVDGAYLVAQYGDSRELTASDEIDVTLRTFVGWAAADIPESWEVLADLDASPQRVVLAVHPGFVTAGAPTG